MKPVLFFIGIILLLSISCNNAGNNSSQNNLSTNKFADTTLQQIAQFQYNRNTEALLNFYNDKEAKYRKAAALAFGSIQDTLAIDKLWELVQDKTPEVRIAAAFAIGQIVNTNSAKILLAQFKKDDNDLVKKELLEAIGKCGDEESLQSIIALKVDFADSDVLSGKAMALARFSIRGIFNEQALSETIRLINAKQSLPEVKYKASIALNRMKLELSEEQLDTIIAAYKSVQDVNTKLNLVAGAGKCKTDKSRMFLQSILDNANDYRLKINALRSLSAFDYQHVNESFFASLNDTSINVAIAASEYFLTHGISKDAVKYDEYRKKVKNWRVIANLFATAIKHANNKELISKSVIKLYKTTQNNYAKAWLLKALGNYLNNFEFVKNEVFSAKEFVISTMGMEALAAMRQSNEFDKYNKKQTAQGINDLEKEFTDIFKKGILSGDEALISISAGVFRNPRIWKYKKPSLGLTIRNRKKCLN